MYDLNNNFKTLLTDYRKSRGYTLESLGNKIGKTKATVSKYEKGEIIPDIITLLEICNSLDIKLSNLFPTKFESKNILSSNPFKSDKLYVYYYTDNILVTSILELIEENNKVFAKFYNGVKNINKYANGNSCYYYEGFLECDEILGYINVNNSNNKSARLEKIQISFSIPWSNSFDLSNCFILGITPNSIPIIKKALISSSPIDDISKFNNDLKISPEELNKIQTNNAWILENQNYAHFFYDK